uniref:Protein Vpu n=1 Tax=Human immunodeficiency virus type 1 TaxID=11676 RepID=D2SSD6_HV1|nr:vpu protein [Human immunodeficiency virus 1]ACX45184.1 vpu protein [Human immunodeficiency virus 1]API70340.1 vpu protein [Human immunodeficiency virus 1]
MDPLVILAIVGLIVAFILAVIVWTIVYIQYKRIKKERKIDWLIKRISERAEDSGNESDGDAEEISKLMEMGNLNFGFVND